MSLSQVTLRQASFVHGTMQSQVSLASTGMPDVTCAHDLFVGFKGSKVDQIARGMAKNRSINLKLA